MFKICVLLLIKMELSEYPLDDLVNLVQKSPPDLQEAFKHACTSILQNKVEVDVRFKHPFNMVLAGPSQSGKSWFVREMLAHKQITPYPSHVVLAYKEWQPLYDDMKEQGLVQSFVQGLDGVSNEINGVTPTLIILDDLQKEVASNEFVSSMFMRGSHHRNCSCIFIVQNLYFQGRKSRDIALNAHYYVIFRNPGDQIQLKEFARRRGQHDMIMHAYSKHCSRKHTFLIIDNSQHTDDRIKMGMPVDSLVEQL